MATADNPTPRPTSTPASRFVEAARPTHRLIDQRESLRSLIRVWLATRDQLLWAFVSGADEPIANITETHVCEETDIRRRLVAIRQMILDAASSLSSLEPSGKTVDALITETAHDLLAVEHPKFLLDNGNGTF